MGSRYRWVPWYGKLGAKLFLAVCKVPHRWLRPFQVHRLGEMLDPDHVGRVFDQYETGLGEPDFSGKVFLELGPGEAISIGLLASAKGCGRTILVDAQDAATRRPEDYATLANGLESRGRPSPTIPPTWSWAELTKNLRLEYQCQGLTSLRALPPDSIDFVVSNAVLEHVEKDEMPLLAAELKRICRPGARQVHIVDYRDHLGGALNNLRFPDSVWESALFRKAGFYTNRIRPSQLTEIFRSQGFHVDIREVFCWDEIPTPRGRLAEAYRSCSDEDLLVSCHTIVASL